MSRFDLHQALSTLVLDLPLKVATPRPPLYLHRALAQSSVPLRGEEWRTPLARDYGRFCERRGTPGDCLKLFNDGPGLDGEDKRDLAFALSVNTALESPDSELKSTFSTTQLWTTLSITLIGYMALIAAPEPVSKGVATALAMLMWGYLGWEFLDLIHAWFQLWEDAAEAATFEELREAGDRFGKVIGPNSVRILLLLGTAAVGETAALVSRAPTLPGFSQAAGSLRSQVQIRDVLAAMQEADKVMVSVAEGTFSVILPTNVLSMAGRDSLTRLFSRKDTVQRHHIATVENEKSNLRGGPWTPKFKKIFDKAGMSMEDPVNQIDLKGHQGPHPQEYHQEVFKRLDQATQNCRNTQECRAALTAALRKLSQLLSQEGSELHRLISGAPSR